MKPVYQLCTKSMALGDNVSDAVLDMHEVQQATSKQKWGLAALKVEPVRDRWDVCALFKQTDEGINKSNVFEMTRFATSRLGHVVCADYPEDRPCNDDDLLAIAEAFAFLLV